MLYASPCLRGFSTMEYLAKNHPECIIVGSAEKKQLLREAELQWIDEVEALDALFTD